MNLGDVGTGCPRCGRSVHEGDCLPPRRPDYPYGAPRPPLKGWAKALLWTLGVLAAAAFVSTLAYLDLQEKRKWRAEDMRRTELCEAQGGIPRYQVRGKGYDGCDFPVAK